MRFPNTPHDLIEQLDRVFPEPSIGPSDTMDEIKFAAGQRSVIAYLKTWRDAPRDAPPPPRRGAGRRVLGVNAKDQG